MAQKTFSPISEAQIKKASIATLADRPNSVSRYGDGGLSAQELKERFDAFPALVQKKINEIIEALASGEAAKYITLNEKSNVLQRDNLYDFIALFSEDTGDNETIADFIEAFYTMDGDMRPDSYSLKEIFADITARFATINADVSKVSNDIAAQSDRIATNEQKTQANAQNIASMQQAITQRDTQISSHEERITGIERYLGGDNFIVDDSTAYEKTVPKNACEKAKVLSLGGMTYKKKTDEGNLMPYPYVGIGGLSYKVANGAITVTSGEGTDFIISSGDAVYPAGTYVFEVGEQKSNYVQQIGLQFYGTAPTVTQLSNYKCQFTATSNFTITRFTARIASSSSQQEEFTVTLHPMLYKADAPITWQPRGYWLSHTKVKAIKSKGTNEFTDSARIFSNYQYISAYMVFTFDGLIPNSPYTISLVNGYKGNAESHAEKYVNLSNKSFEPINSGALGWLVHPQERYCNDLHTVTSSADGKLYLRLYGYNDQIQLSELFSICTNIMLNIGESAFPYTPYVGTIDTFTIPEEVQAREGYGAGTLDGNNHIYYADNGKVYYSKPIKVYEFTGDEDLGEYGSTNDFFRCVLSAVDDALPRQTNALCSHLPIGDFANSFSIDSGITRFSFRFAYNFFVSGETTTAERIETIRQWLRNEKAKGTPVTTVYLLEFPPIDTDITDLMPKENLIKVLGGCRIAAVNEQNDPVPFSIKYLVTYPKGG